MDNVIEEEILREISDEPEEGAVSSDVIPDKDVLSVDELLDRIIGSINLLDHIDEYKEEVSKKRREVAYREFDLLHTAEDLHQKMAAAPDFKLSAKGCRNFFEDLSEVRELRRKLKVSDELIYEFQKKLNRLNNAANRGMLRSEMTRDKNRLTQPHRNRIYTPEQLNKLFDIKEGIENETDNQED